MSLPPSVHVTISVDGSEPVEAYQPIEGGWRFKRLDPYGLSLDGNRMTFQTIDALAERICEIKKDNANQTKEKPMTETYVPEATTLLEVDHTGPWKIGQKYLIRTVTMTLTGRLIEVHPGELLLEHAAWIADTGRFADAVRDGSYSEVEPFIGHVIVGRGAVIDATAITHDLPTVQK